MRVCRMAERTLVTLCVLSVAHGMIRVVQTTADTTGPGSPDASGGPEGGVRRTRGANKAPAWRWDGPVSVIRLPLVVDEQAAARLESLFFAMFCLKRAVQREARSRTEAFWAGARRREADAAAWRREVGLTRPALERAAYAHLDASGWLRHHVTKALALHQADEVWTGVERHLFPDSSGRRAGRPRTGSWWEYTRIPGRAVRTPRRVSGRRSGCTAVCRGIWTPGGIPPCPPTWPPRRRPRGWRRARRCWPSHAVCPHPGPPPLVGAGVHGGSTTGR